MIVWYSTKTGIPPKTTTHCDRVDVGGHDLDTIGWGVGSSGGGLLLSRDSLFELVRLEWFGMS